MPVMEAMTVDLSSLGTAFSSTVSASTIITAIAGVFGATITIFVVWTLAKWAIRQFKKSVKGH